MSEKTVKIDPKQLFLSASDIRKYLSVGISDYVISEIEREWEVDHDLIDDILNHAGIYVRQDLLPRHIEVKEIERRETESKQTSHIQRERVKKT